MTCPSRPARHDDLDADVTRAETHAIKSAFYPTSGRAAAQLHRFVYWHEAHMALWLPVLFNPSCVRLAPRRSGRAHQPLARRGLRGGAGSATVRGGPCTSMRPTKSYARRAPARRSSANSASSRRCNRPQRQLFCGKLIGYRKCGRARTTDSIPTRAIGVRIASVGGATAAS